MSNERDFVNQQTILISELLIKISAIENLMLSKGIISKDDVDCETKKVVSQLTKLVEENVKNQGSI